MNRLLFCAFSGFGIVLMLSGLSVMPPLFSVKWWLVIVGFALLANAFNPENCRDE